MYEYEATPDAGLGILGMLPMLFMLWGVATWLLGALAMLKMAKKTGHSDSGWWGFIPILNVFLLCKLASKPAWWFVLCLIPGVNLIVFAIMWMDAAKACGQSPLWGLLTLVPFINLIALGVLAFGSSAPARTKPSIPSQSPRTPTPVG